MNIKTRTYSSRYWIAVANLRHVEAGIKGGFAQLGHGKERTVMPLSRGDWLVYYSPRTELDGGDRVQAFTAIGRVLSKVPYEVDEGAGFKPFRLNMKYRKSASPAAIHALLPRLELTAERGSHWGVVFRQSRIEVSRADFRKIARAMNFDLPKTR